MILDKLASGVYWIRMTSGDFTATSQFVVIESEQDALTCTLLQSLLMKDSGVLKDQLQVSLEWY